MKHIRAGTKLCNIHQMENYQNKSLSSLKSMHWFDQYLTCVAFRDLERFIQFKKREKHP